MRRKGDKKYRNGKKFYSALVFILFLLGLILPKSAKADNGEKYLNYFYAMAINNVLSVAKTSNIKEEYPNNKNDIEISALSILGINTFSPISIITKEIAYLDKNEVSNTINNASNEGEDINTIIPFKLTGNDVSNSKESNVVADSSNINLNQTINKSNPRILIYHTHTSEAFRTSDKDSFNTNSSLDQTRNVVAVGDVIKTELEKTYGISVVHDKTVHDTGDYDNAYKKSGITLDKYLKSYGDFDLIIDLHRDGVLRTNKTVLKTKINGEDAALALFVVTRQNSRYSKQKKLVDAMVGISNKIYPGLLDPREIYYHDWGINFYNQGKSDNSILIEVGNQNNTIHQAKNTGMYLSRIIAKQLNGKK